MEEKNIDRIKKISEKDMKKSRKIVLDSIGEAFDDLAEEKIKPIPTAQVDSIKKVVKNIEKPIKKTDDGQKKKWQKQWSSIRTDKNEQSTEGKKEPSTVIPSPPVPKPAKRKPRIKKKHPESKGFATFGKRNVKKTPLKKKLPAKTAKQKSKPTKTSYWQKFKIKTKLFLKTSFRTTKKAVNRLITVLLVILLIYIIFVVLVVKLKTDNILLRKIDAYIPIPAAISTKDYVDYFKYIDASKFMEEEYSDGPEEKAKIIKTIIYNDLIKEYNLTGLEPDKAEYKLRQLIIFHPDVNQVSLARIKNIDRIIAENSDLSYQAKQFGDESGTIELNSTNENQLAFSDSAKQLDIGQISKIIYTNEGYYILKCLNKSNNSGTFEYVFVKANSLDEYINKKAQNSNYFFLIN